MVTLTCKADIFMILFVNLTNLSEILIPSSNTLIQNKEVTRYGFFCSKSFKQVAAETHDSPAGNSVWCVHSPMTGVRLCKNFGFGFAAALVGVFACTGTPICVERTQ